jgi:CheY-like chemotaxis protein
LGERVHLGSRTSPLPQKVMFVDDEEDIVEVITISLEEHGYSVESFTDPFVALERFRQSSPDEFAAVVADIRMPNMDGVAFAIEVLKIMPTANIILMTGLDINDNPFLRAQRQLTKKCEFIQKPFRTFELINKLRPSANPSAIAGRIDDVHPTSM